MVKSDKFFLKVGLQILMPVILEHLCENNYFSLTIPPPPRSLSQNPKLSCSMPPASCRDIYLNDYMGFPLLNFSAIANFPVFHPPKEVLPG